MKCRRARGLIYDFIDGVIDEQNRVALEQHLGECKSCEEMSVGLSRSLDLLHRVKPAEPDDSFTWKVRLRLARERNALSDPVGADRNWMRSWNRRFALGAVSAFIVVMGATYFVSRSSFVPAGMDPASRLAQLPRSQSTEAKKAEPERADVARKEGSDAPVPAAGRAGRVVVSSDGGLGAGGMDTGPLKQDTGPALDLDSLMRQLMASAARDVAETHRLRSMKEQIDLLNEELRECGKRCGEEHDHGVHDE
ncbi:MAG: anti-sigma factor family protein [Candidatus Krumholzibacteriia bacterium]